jgi:hypothetical protein
LENAHSAMSRNTVVGITGRNIPTTPRPTFNQPKAISPWRTPGQTGVSFSETSSERGKRASSMEGRIPEAP